MTRKSADNSSARPGPYQLGEHYYRDLRRRHIVRLLLTYILPILLLSLYFGFQYRAIDRESRILHLKAIAENQANTLDLFLTERRGNLDNLIDDPRFELPPSSPTMASYLEKLQMNSETFVDLGYFDSSGVQRSYVGPFPFLEQKNYSSEPWYVELKARTERFITTDIYLGFRQQPHFTIGVSRVIDGQYVVLRATLDPRRMYDYISSLEGAADVYVSIVNKEGYYQVVTPHIGTPLESSSIVPPHDEQLGAEEAEVDGASLRYAYSWLRTADWALIAQPAETTHTVSHGFWYTFFGLSGLVALLIFVVICNRAGKLVEMQKESDRTRAQLEHAAKLASVGELAAGIAHEINNPLAIINEEAGLMKDLMNPEFGRQTPCEELIPRLDTIQTAVFRCRDITRKLLGFVRKSDIDLKAHDIHRLIDEVVVGLLGTEMAVANIEIVKDYAENLPPLMTDGNQLEQVILNIVKNGVDALEEKPGTITIATWREGNLARIALRDSGKGMSADQLGSVFVPFYTTKEVGKGTGLGLSVSYGIIKTLGGQLEVDSQLGKGSTFTITLPLE